MPAGPYVGRSGGFELFGVVPPFEVYSVYAAVNGSGLVVRVGDPNCGVSEQCIRTSFYPQPGAYRIDTGINAPAGMPVYIDQNYLIAVTSTFRGFDCARCATIGWYVPQVSWVAIIHDRGSTTTESWQVGSGPYTCIIRTDGFRNTVAFEGRYWQIECGYYNRTYDSETFWPPQWKSLGVVKLVFNNDYTISVYKDGQYLYKVPVYVCRGPLITCGSGPWAPTQRLVIPVSWGSGGITMSIAQFRYNRNDVGYETVGNVGYGGGIVHVRDVQTVALPYYYKYNLTGAYPYRLDVQIVTAEKNITQAGDWVYINVTYSGYLKLYLGDKLVAYDALYGWTIRQDQAPPSGGGGSVSKPNGTCVIQRKEIPKGVVHGDLQQGQNGYSVKVGKRFEVHEFGCGVDRRYEVIRNARVNTVSGTSYQNTDPNNNVCGYQSAQDCSGIVYCGGCQNRRSG
jgi:hypothetical protein